MNSASICIHIYSYLWLLKLW